MDVWTQSLWRDQHAAAKIKHIANLGGLQQAAIMMESDKSLFIEMPTFALLSLELLFETYPRAWGTLQITHFLHPSPSYLMLVTLALKTSNFEGSVMQNNANAWACSVIKNCNAKNCFCWHLAFDIKGRPYRRA